MPHRTRRRMTIRICGNPQAERLRKKISKSAHHPMTPELAAGIAKNQELLSRHLGLYRRRPPRLPRRPLWI